MKLRETEGEFIFPPSLSKGFIRSSSYICVLMEIVFVSPQQTRILIYFSLAIPNKIKSLADIYPKSSFVTKRSINKSIRRD